MMSKTVICVFLLAVVAISYAKPHHDQSSEHRQRNGQNQRDCDNVSQQQDNNSDSDESDRVPCRLTNEEGQRQQQGRKQPLHIQDTSNEYEVRRFQIVTSQEESNAEKVIKQGPAHKVVSYATQKGSEFMHGAKSMINRQRARDQNAESQEQNSSDAGRNQINRH